MKLLENYSVKSENKALSVVINESSKLKLVVNIPCYNEEKTIEKVIKAVPKKIPGIDRVEIQVIDDGSTDKTVEIARSLGVIVLRNKKNMGLGITFRRAMNHALKNGADVIVNIDGDGQFDAADIPKLIEPILDENADMVTCTRFMDPRLVQDMPLIKKIGNKIFTSIISAATGRRFTDTQCGFRAYTREAALKMNLFGTFTYTQEVFLDLIEKEMKIVEVPLKVIYTKERKSKMVKSYWKYTMRSLGIITRASRDINPLSFFGLPALIILCTGLLGAVFSFFYWTIEHMTTPVRTLGTVSFFLVIVGAIMGILALIADMILRLRRTNEELLYRIKKKEYDYVLENTDMKRLK